MPDEESKAVTEVAKATSKGLDLIKGAGEFVGRIIGPAADQIGASLGDWAALWKYKNLCSIRDKYDALNKARTAAGKVIPLSPRLGIPFLEKASLEDDPTLQSLWAGLLANATNEAMRLSVRKVMAEILGSMEPLDALIMIYLHKQGWKQVPGVVGDGISVSDIQLNVGAEVGDINWSLQNLFRLGCVKDRTKHNPFEELNESMRTPEDRRANHPESISTDSGIRIGNKNARYMLTPLGGELIKACLVDDSETATE